MRSATIFCLNCGSCLVDIVGWSDRDTTRVECRGCGSKAQLKGFTLGRTFRDAHLREAALQVATYNQNQAIVNKIRAKVETGSRYKD